MSSVIAQKWINESHRVIPVGYASAIANYSAQKESFLQRLQTEENVNVNNFMERLNNEIAIEAESEMDTTFDAAFEAVKTYIEEYIVQAMESGNTNYQTLINRFQKVIDRQSQRNGQDPKTLYTSLKKDIEAFLLNTNNTTRKSLASYVAQQSGLGGTQNTDIQNNLFGYARKLIMKKLMGLEMNHSTQHYKISLKGYYKEQVLVPALNKVLQEYGIIAKQAGSMYNTQGQQIKYDILLGTSNLGSMADEAITPLISQMEQLSTTVQGTGQVDTSLPLIGGIQSKSWVAPWSLNSVGGNRNFLSFGHNTNLMPIGEDAHYWHAGVYNVMSNLLEAIGPSNFIYATGDTVYWTADLLAEFRERQYVLAFYYNKTEGKIVSSSISAQPHND